MAMIAPGIKFGTVKNESDMWKPTKTSSSSSSGSNKSPNSSTSNSLAKAVAQQPSLNKTYQTQDIGETGYVNQDSSLAMKPDGSYAYIANSLLNGGNSYSNPLENGLTYTKVTDPSSVDYSKVNPNIALNDWRGRGGAAPGEVKTDYSNSNSYSGGYSDNSIDSGSLINSQYDSIAAALKAAIAQQKNNKQLEINGLGAKYQPQKNTSEVTKNNDLRTALEISTNNGDRGGIGRQQALDTQTAGANRLNQIGLQQTSDETSLKNDIANLVLEGDVQQAQNQAARLKDLIANNQYVDETTYNRSQDSLQNALAAQKTAYEQSQDTLNRTDQVNEAMGYVNPTANVVVPDSIRQQLAQYSNDYTAFINKTTDPTLKQYATALKNEKIFSSAANLAKYGEGYKTATQKQQDFNNKATTIDNQIKELELEREKTGYMTPQEKVELETAQFNLNQAKKLAPYDLQQAALSIENAKASIANIKSTIAKRSSSGSSSSNGSTSLLTTSQALSTAKNALNATETIGTTSDGKPYTRPKYATKAAYTTWLASLPITDKQFDAIYAALDVDNYDFYEAVNAPASYTTTGSR